MIYPEREVVMLVLSRAVDEKIRIGDDLEIVIVDVKGDKVRVGVSAHRNLSVDRDEVSQAIAQEEVSSGKMSSHFNFGKLFDLLGEDADLKERLERLGIIVIVPKPPKETAMQT